MGIASGSGESLHPRNEQRAEEEEEGGRYGFVARRSPARPKERPLEPPAPAQADASAAAGAPAAAPVAGAVEPEPASPPLAESGPAGSFAQPASEAAAAEGTSLRAAGAPDIGYADPRFADVEPLLSHNDWDAICKVLGPPEAADGLPPSLALIYAVARKEHAGAESAGDANELAIRNMGAMFGVPPSSPIALIMAKRLLRANPVTWRKKSAPPVGASLAIAAIALAIGAAAGWLLGPGALGLL